MKDLTKLSILVAEDGGMMRALIVKTLKKNAIGNVTQAGNGKQALDAVLLMRPDLIISDLNMPVMNGVELLGELQQRSEFKDIPFVVLTSQTNDATFKKIMSMGAADFIRKPFNEEQLMIKLKSVAEWIK